MNTHDSGGAAGRETAPEGKDPDRPGPGGATADGKDAGVGGGGGDPGEQRATEARYDTLEGMMKKDTLDINWTLCGPQRLCALDFALGEEGEPYDEKATKLVLGVSGVDVNAPGHLGQSVLLVQCSFGRSRNVALLLADPRVDVNQGDSEGNSPLFAAANKGKDRCVALLLADPRVDVNQVCLKGESPLFAAAYLGRDRCLEILLADPRVDVNQVNLKGESPLFIAANLGMDRCVELLLADKRVDVCLPNADGMSPLLSACIQLMKSMDQVGVAGGNDPAHCLVLMLRSRRLPKHNVEETIQRMGDSMPTRRQIDAAAAGRPALDPPAAKDMPHRPPRARAPGPPPGRVPLVHPLPEADPRREPPPMWWM
jgi:hypothetical protein